VQADLRISIDSQELEQVAEFEHLQSVAEKKSESPRTTTSRQAITVKRFQFPNSTAF